MSATKSLVGHDELGRFIRDVLVAHGAREQDAAIVAEGLVWANLRGGDGHGVSRLPRYVKFIARGEIDTKVAAAADARSRRDFRARLRPRLRPGRGRCRPPRSRSSGQRRSASASGWFARPRIPAPSAATRNGSRSAAAPPCCMGAGPALMAYHGARVASMGTSPIAIAVPSGNGPIVLDMATSTISNGKILQARATGAPLPPGTVLTADGEPTTDPRQGRNPAAARRPEGLGPRPDVRNAGERARRGADPGAHARPGKAHAQYRKYRDVRHRHRDAFGRSPISRTMPTRWRRSSRRCRGKRASTKSCCPASAPAAPKPCAANPAFRFRRNCGRSWKRSPKAHAIKMPALLSAPAK